MQRNQPGSLSPETLDVSSDILSMSPLESARISLEEGMKSNNLLQDQITDSQKDRLQSLPQINNVNKGSLNLLCRYYNVDKDSLFRSRKYELNHWLSLPLRKQQLQIKQI